MTAKLHQTLWAANADLSRAIRRHPFVQGLADGSLDPEAFRRYVAQDAFFLAAFARGYALAAARSDRIEDVAMFHQLMGSVLEEMQTHRRYAARLGIELDAVEPYEQTLAYTEFLSRTAWSSGLAETIAAMTPCMRVYAYLGLDLAAGGVPDHVYGDWIRTYASDEFQAAASTLESALDRFARDTAPVRNAYRKAMSCELEFFGAPLDP